jgi:YVTN family beta-propeller protein
MAEMVNILSNSILKISIKCVTLMVSIIIYLLYLPAILLSPYHGLAQEAFSNLSVTKKMDIKISEQPTDIAVNDNLNKVYVWDDNTPSKNNTIYVIDGSKSKVEDTIQIGGHVSDLAVDSKINKIYGISRISDKEHKIYRDIVAVINGTNNVITKYVKIGGDLTSVDINRNTNEVYVLNSTHVEQSNFEDHAAQLYRNYSISVIDSSKDEVVYVIPLEGTGYNLMEVNPVLNKIYLADSFNNITAVLNIKTKKFSFIPMNVSLENIAVNPSTNRIYGSNTEANRLFVINSNSDSFLTTFIASTVDDSTFYEASHGAIAVDPNSDMVYMVNPGSDSVSVLNGSAGLLYEIEVGKSPEDIAVNPTTSKIYTANSGSNSVSIIEASVSTTIDRSVGISKGDIPGIKVGKVPFDIDVDPDTNMIYVGNHDSQTVSVIGGPNNVMVNNIPIGNSVWDIALNPTTNMLYVRAFDPFSEQKVSVIDISTNTIVGAIQTNATDIDIALDTNRLYLTGDDSITVIDEISNKTLANIRRYDFEREEGQPFPKAIAAITSDNLTKKDKIYAITSDYVTNRYALNIINFNPKSNDTVEILGTVPLKEEPSTIAINDNTQMAYAANQRSDTVSIIDLYVGKIIGNISVGKTPIDISANPNTNTIYVANVDDDNISVIDGLHNQRITTIPTGKSPSTIAANYDKNTVYVANHDSNTVSVIDTLMNKVIVPGNVSFSIIPSNSGHIRCNDSEFPTEQPLRIAFGTQCIADHNKGFQFSSWTEDLGRNSTKTISTAQISDSLFNSLLAAFGFNPIDNASLLNITKTGNFTATFKELPPPVPQQYLIGLYTLAATVFTGWFVPTIARWLNSVLQRKHLKEYLFAINTLDQNNDRYLQQLDELKSNITYSYAKGKISELHYNLLNKKISDYENSNSLTNKT